MGERATGSNYHESAQISACARRDLAGAATRVALADVRPHPLFSDNMVLQRGMPVPVWGTADDGERVIVKIQDQEAQETPGTASGWSGSRS